MIIFLNRLPIPNLRHYCLLSLFLFLLVILYANKVLHDIAYNRFARYSQVQTPSPAPAELAQLAVSTNSNEPDQPLATPTPETLVAANVNKSNVTTVYDFAYVEANGYLLTILKIITSEPWCIWVLINFCYCGLLLFSKVIQRMVFGKLRAVENQHIKDQFWNFIFLKFIFIFGVLNLENMNDLIMWCTWFSIIGWLSIHCQICKDRFEYLSFSTSTPMRSHVKVYVLLVCIQLLCIGLIVVSFITQRKIGFSFGLFMLAEAFGLTLRTLYVISKYSVHLCDLRQTELWESKGTITYYIDFTFEMCVVSIDFLHYFHMLIYGNFYLSMASLVICMELKRLFVDLRRRMRRHSNYLRVIEKMEKRFPWANQAELNYSEKCAVCWEKLDKARRLPCSHIFHHNCLRSWLEQDTSCPTCRKSLQDEKPPTVVPATATTQQQQPEGGEGGGAVVAAGENQQAQQQQQPPLQRNYFHFEGSRYISWLPSFSVQVTHNLGGNQANNGGAGGGGGGGGMASAFLRRANLILGGAGGGRRYGLEPARLLTMTEQVRQLFPNVPIEVIQHDLNRTHSVEITIENILEERINLFNVNANNNANNNNNGDFRVTNNNNATTTTTAAVNHFRDHDELLDDDDEDDDIEDLDEEDDEEDMTMDDDDDDDDEYEEVPLNDDNQNNTSSDDDHHHHRHHHHHHQQHRRRRTATAPSGTATTPARTAASIFSNLLGGGGSGSRRHAASTTEATASTSAMATTRNNSMSSLLERYVTSPRNSDNTNALIQKKRDLILNSKKRFLERQQQQQQPTEATTSSSTETTTTSTDDAAATANNEDTTTVTTPSPQQQDEDLATSILRQRRSGGTGQSGSVNQ